LISTASRVRRLARAEIIAHSGVRLEWDEPREVAIATQFVSRQHVVDVLRTAGLMEEADEAARELPDPVEVDRAAQFLAPHGITLDALISRMGGSP
jgi:hypothetical protein